MNYFMKLVIAKIKGDDAEAQAIKVQKSVTNALKAEISVKESALFKAENKLENIIEKQSNVLINEGKRVEDDEGYINALIKSETEVKIQKKNVKQLKETVDFLKEKLTMIQEETVTVKTKK